MKTEWEKFIEKVAADAMGQKRIRVRYGSKEDMLATKKHRSERKKKNKAALKSRKKNRRK